MSSPFVEARPKSLRRRSATLAATLALVCLLPVVAMPWAGAAPGDLTLASTSTGGTKGNSDSVNPSFSADGTKVAFQSQASNLDLGDTDITSDVYVKDFVTGTLTLASTSSDDLAKGNANSFEPSLSADGTRVAFESGATNLDPGDTDFLQDVYVKDLVTGTLTLASTSSGGTKGNGNSFDVSLSADGTEVAFDSTSSNLDPGDSDGFSLDVYVKDLVSGTVTLASTSSGGTKGNNISLRPSLSADGTTVAFESLASNLDPVDSDGLFDVYVKQLLSGTLFLASTSSLGIKGNSGSFTASLSADGSDVAFDSGASNLDTGDTDGSFDVYVKDLSSATLTLASKSTGGTKGNSDSYDPSITPDGTKVAFQSAASNLDTGDTDGLFDVYEKELLSGTLFLASTSIGGTKGNGDSTTPSLSADGTSVAFGSVASNLDSDDTDSIPDVYVKEIGGAPEPVGVTIKIKKSGAIYTVTVITTPIFDATTVDATTVCFGDAQAPAERDCTEVDGAGQLKDADRDGDLDMLLQFEAAQTGIDPGDTQACLTGETIGATPFEGCGTVKPGR